MPVERADGQQPRRRPARGVLLEVGDVDDVGRDELAACREPRRLRDRDRVRTPRAPSPSNGRSDASTSSSSRAQARAASGRRRSLVEQDRGGGGDESDRGELHVPDIGSRPGVPLPRARGMLAPVTGLELLAEHVERFNAGVRSGDFAADGGAVRRTTPRSSSEGVPVGPFHGREAIAAAYREQPPDDRDRRAGRLADRGRRGGPSRATRGSRDERPGLRAI